MGQEIKNSSTIASGKRGAPQEENGKQHVCCKKVPSVWLHQGGSDTGRGGLRHRCHLPTTVRTVRSAVACGRTRHSGRYDHSTPTSFNDVYHLPWPRMSGSLRGKDAEATITGGTQGLPEGSEEKGGKFDLLKIKEFYLKQFFVM